MTRLLVKSLRSLTFLFTVNNNLITGGKHDEGYIHVHTGEGTKWTSISQPYTLLYGTLK